jgi:type IV pilus assembly protein PilC
MEKASLLGSEPDARVNKRQAPKQQANTKKRPPRVFGMKEDKEYFIENLSLLLSSGIDIISALKSIAAEVKSKNMRRILNDVIVDVESGSELWESLQQRGLFSGYTVSLIRIGEQSGRLVENLRVIADQQQKDTDFRAKIRSALAYPAIVFSLTIILGTVVTWFILPRLAGVFTGLDVDLPFVSKVLIQFGNFLRENGIWVIPLFFSAIIAFVIIAFVIPQTKVIGQTIILNTPGMKRLFKEVEVARSTFILGMLLGAGLSIIDALNSLIVATNFQVYKQFYRYLKTNVEEGKSFQTSFSTYKGAKKLMPGPVQQIIIAGERSGHLAETLTKIGQVYQSKAENSAKNLTTLLEPVLLVIVWAGVFMIALSVILPIYSLIGGLSSQ